VRSFTGSYGKILAGVGGAYIGSYLGWWALLKAQESSEYTRLVSRNDCAATPLWRSES